MICQFDMTTNRRGDSFTALPPVHDRAAGAAM
jgi:hypothetical protein